MKGIVLAGGAGTRLYPLTQVASKQLQPVYDKPMVYYPLATLLDAGIRDILLISTPHDIPRFEALLGNGSQVGHVDQLRRTADTSGDRRSADHRRAVPRRIPRALILGDNIFFGAMGIREIVASFTSGAVIFGYPVKDPGRYGVVTVDTAGAPVELVEKPSESSSHLAVPGLYLYGGDAPGIARRLTPSDRGELEITDVNRAYLERGDLKVIRLGQGIAWLDSGTHESLLEAANFIATIEHRQGVKIACLEEIALRTGAISLAEFEALVEGMSGRAIANTSSGLLRSTHDCDHRADRPARTRSGVGSRAREVRTITEDELDFRHLDEIPRALGEMSLRLPSRSSGGTGRSTHAEYDVDTARLVNATAVGALATACADLGARFVTFSTDYVFDGTRAGGYVESDQTSPKSVYGVTKLEGEHLALENDRDALVVRTSWLLSETRPNFASTMIKLIRNGPVKVVDDQRGRPTLADDLARVTLDAVDREVSGVLHLENGVQHGSAWPGRSRRSPVSTPNESTPCTTDEFPRPAPRPADSVLNSERVAGLGIELMPPYGPGLEAAVLALMDSEWT